MSQAIPVLHLLAIAAVVAIPVALATPGEAQLAGPEVEAVRQMNSHYFRSWREHDMAWYRENLAENFAFIGGDGTVMGKEGFLAVPDMRASIREAHIEDLVIRVYPGGTAVVSGNTVVTRMDGTMGATRYIDVWAKIGGKWKAVSAQLTGDRNFKAPAKAS